MTKHTSSLTQSASKSVLWTFIGSFGGSGLRFISTAVLARILTPEEFGLVGMAVLFTGIVTLFGKLGMGAALVQKIEVDDLDLSTAYWTSIGTGLVLFLISLGIAPMASNFFSEPNVKFIIMLLGLNFVFSAFASVHATLLGKELRFKEINLIDLICNVARIATILGCALVGLSFWSIAIGIVVERILKTFLMIRQFPWRPKFIFSRERFGELFRYGRNLYGQSFIGYFNSNMDYVITGKFLGAANLALYQFAYNIPHLIHTHIAQNVNDVAFPLYCKVQTEKERLEKGYLKTVKYISLLAFPLLMGLCITAEQFILTAYGTKWQASIGPLRILCLAGYMKTLVSSVYPLLQSKGRPDIGFKWNLILLPLTAVTIIFSARWNITGVAVGMTFLSCLFIFLILYALRICGMHAGLYFNSLLPSFVSGFIMAVALVMLQTVLPDFHPAIKLLILSVSGGLVYILSLRQLFRSDFNDFTDFVVQVFKRKKG